MDKFIKEITIDTRERVLEKRQVVIRNVEAENIINQFKDNIKSIRAKFSVCENLINSGFQDDGEDIFRSQIVFLESAFDFYLHEIVRFSIIKIFKGEKQKTDSYKNIIVSIETLESALKNPENIDWLNEDIIHKNSFKTFVSENEVKKILSLISTQKVFNEASGKLGMTQQQLSSKIDELYKRRNKIAHQSDRDNKTNSLCNITNTEVLEYIDLVEKFVKEIHVLVTNDL